MESGAIEMLLGLRLIPPPPNDFTNQPEQLLRFLARNLRNGRVLCQLVEKICPECFRRRRIRYYKSDIALQSEYNCLQNINWFLEVVQEEFAVSPTFDATELYHWTDLKKVVDVLSLLSRNDNAKRLGVVTFPLQNQPVYDDPAEEEIELYSTLPGLLDVEDSSSRDSMGSTDFDGMMSQVPAPMFRTQSQISTATQFNNFQPEVYDDETDAIYGVLVAATEAPTGRYINQTDSSPSPFDDFDNEQGEQLYSSIPKTKRDYIIAEIYDTEEKYVKQLNNMIRYFLQPLRNVLSPDEIEAIFINLEELRNMHEKFFADLEAVATERHEHRTISKPFKAFQDRLSNYAIYLLGIDHSLEVLDQVLSGVSRARELIELGEKKASPHAFKLHELIKVPMQRVLKYPLIVKRLMENSTESHPDYHELKYVNDTLLDLNQYINRTKADMERSIKPMERLQNHIDKREIPLTQRLSAYGGVLMDCMATKWGDKSSSTKSKIHIFVFNMAVVVFEMSTDGLPIRQLWNMPIRDVTPLNIKKIAGLRIFGTNGYEIKLRFSVGSGEQTALLKTEKDAKDFKGKIEIAKKKYATGGDEYDLCDVPCDFTKGELPICCACKKLFHGIKSQGYRKRGKDDIYVHGKCIDRIRAGELSVTVQPPLPQRDVVGRSNSKRPISRESSLESPGPVDYRNEHRQLTRALTGQTEGQSNRRGSQPNRPTSTPQAQPRSPLSRSQRLSDQPTDILSRQISEPNISSGSNGLRSLQRNLQSLTNRTPRPDQPIPTLTNTRTKKVAPANHYVMEQTESFDHVENLNHQLEDQTYYEPNLDRDMANLVLNYGDFRCFVVRSRATAEDSKGAPFAISFKTPENRIQHMRIFKSEIPLKYWLCRNDKFDSVTMLIQAYGHAHLKDLNSAFPELNGYLGESAIKSRGRIRYNSCPVSILREHRHNQSTWVVFPKDRLRSRSDIVEYANEHDVILDTLQ